jgi:hypothetical protein
MGVDFLGKTKKSFVKHIDSGRAKLAEWDLLTVLPTNQARSFVASLEVGVTVQDGETLITQAYKGELHLVRDNTPIGKFDKLPADIIKAIEASGGLANGVVHRTHRFSNKVDLTLC